MNRIKNTISISLIVLALGIGACAQDETMDDIINNTEINNPSFSDSEDTANKDLPDGD